MIVKADLSPVQVARYTRKPMAWVVGWAVAAPFVYLLVDASKYSVPFPVVAALAAVLSIFIAFRNNSAFARWTEARSAWQSILVASRNLMRQVVASTEDAIVGGTADRNQVEQLRGDVADLLAAFAYRLGSNVVPTRQELRHRADRQEQRLNSEGPDETIDHLAQISAKLKDGIRSGQLGQFDPISLEPQLVALASARGTVERIASTPTLRQYDYFTRRGVQAFALLTPFAIVGLIPAATWMATPLAIVLGGTLVMMMVTGAVNDDPFSGGVTDVPVESICVEVERAVGATIRRPDVPQQLRPVDGYLY